MYFAGLLAMKTKRQWRIRDKLWAGRGPAAAKVCVSAIAKEPVDRSPAIEFEDVSQVFRPEPV